ncbi:MULTISPECIES: TIGR02444 family protein [Salinicola]|uniref:TIGR02444 family protein n=1 Tax=Salinicola socius TaxID=404433 RepID=A0A1Q8SWD4_9GAMM|nr:MULTISPECIES: TIGR02444 family protein [Salinicola]OLO05740.1 TIGR02444 family protein [Salinicola socius]
MSATDAAASLWSYALSRYARPGVEAECLTLQDEHGWDVCELLWIAWLSERRQRPDPKADHALADARRWQREMTLPLRERRRTLKIEVQHRPRLESLRQALKQAELYAEREMLTQLAALPTIGAAPDAPLKQALDSCRVLREVTAEAYPPLRDLLARWIIDAPDAEPKPTC